MHEDELQRAIETDASRQDAVRGTEKAQAVIRFYIGTAAATYILAAIVSGMISPRATFILLPYMAVFFAAAYGFVVWIKHDPGVSHCRRAAAMFMDYGSIALVLALGGETMLPISAALIWITVGYGMRYGPRYLFAGTAASLVSISIATILSNFWLDNPFVLATVVLSVLMVPIYANALLKRTRLAHEDAVAANRAKSQVLAQASHDLRQPVHAIGLFTNCLRDAQLGPDEQLMVGGIERSLQSISRLFKSLLDVSTLDSGRVVVRQEPVSLHELLSDLVHQNTQAAQWAGVELRMAHTTLRVLSDPALLNTMVQNLLSNALKYAPDAPVLIGCRKRGGGVAIEVHDCGPGIPAEHLRHVFDEFYRVPRAGHDVEGVGLGLSIVRRMAALLALTVSVRSRASGGVAFAIEGLQIAPHEANELRVRRHPTPLDGMKVLLIEDDPEVHDATSTLLQKWGCEVTSCEEADCDLVIIDFDLGDGDNGYQFLTKLREARGQRVPAILITGHEAVASQVMLDDDIPILAKPLRPAELRGAVVAQRLAQVRRPD